MEVTEMFVASVEAGIEALQQAIGTIERSEVLNDNYSGPALRMAVETKRQQLAVLVDWVKRARNLDK